MLQIKRPLVLVRGAGDIATGIIYRLFKAGVAVVALEIQNPSVIRRTVALAEAVMDGVSKVESLTGRLVETPTEATLPDFKVKVERLIEAGEIPIVVDARAELAFLQLGQVALIDAVLAKKNYGTHKGMAPVVVAVGPGFEAGVDCHAVVETMRGHDLGRVIYEGKALPNTGVPGEIAGHSLKRLIKAPCEGVVRNLVSIGDFVKAGDSVQCVGDQRVISEIDGVVRGLIREGYWAHSGLKIGDVDPRAEARHCHTISDKALSIGGGVLQVVLEKSMLLVK